MPTIVGAKTKAKTKRMNEKWQMIQTDKAA